MNEAAGKVVGEVAGQAGAEAVVEAVAKAKPKKIEAVIGIALISVCAIAAERLSILGFKTIKKVVTSKKADQQQATEETTATSEDAGEKAAE